MVVILVIYAISIEFFSRPIIDVPRILQLCEGLYASGQPPELFVAPALIPVAVDLFCKRSNFGEAVMQTGAGVGADNISELDAQREVMLCMLLKVKEVKMSIFY